MGLPCRRLLTAMTTMTEPTANAEGGPKLQDNCHTWEDRRERAPPARVRMQQRPRTALVFPARPLLPAPRSTTRLRLLSLSGLLSACAIERGPKQQAQSKVQRNHPDHPTQG
jgi:hypothetical protein